MRSPGTKSYKPNVLTFEFQFWTPRSKKGGSWTSSGQPTVAVQSSLEMQVLASLLQYLHYVHLLPNTFFGGGGV